MDYSKTVNLPKTDFPMKADLPRREPLLLEQWEKNGLYEKMLAHRQGQPRFVLHDGPPYANGATHIGHSLNKILKDIVVKYHTLRGFQSPYVPGWDCHGLPIENALMKEKKTNKRGVERLAFRKEAAAYAQKYIDLQRDEFKRLGVLGDWDHPYLTMDPKYEAVVLRCFRELFEKGFIYRGKKPVYWCASCETALADAEVEYENHTSPSIYVAFPGTFRKKKFTGENSTSGDEIKVKFVIWTTTPWTLPANVAIAINENENYVVVRTSQHEAPLLVAEKRLDAFLKECGLKGEVIMTLAGKEVAHAEYVMHPWLNRRASVIPGGDFVAMDTGTGLVHIAPGHGVEDFHLGQQHQLEVLSPVDDRGRFTDEVPEWKGEHVTKANPKIIEFLKEKGALVGQQEISHSYPHCWRCKHPIIFRATEQWFLKIDHEGLREKLLHAIDEVTWSPAHAQGKLRIGGMVQTRPDWCLSRQRHWGTPIPVVFCVKCSEPMPAGEQTEKMVAQHGSDIWFEKPVSELLAKGTRCKKCQGTEFRKEEDILDVWFDSGVSFAAVVKARPELQGGETLYLEGSDQHRGWFQVSLIPSVALQGKAPYDEVLTHGFVVDGQGKKMSKSLGNVVAPQQVIKDFGAEILRFWTASSNYAEDVRLSPEIVKVQAESYRKIRNTIRFILGNLSDFTPTAAVSRSELLELDHWAMDRLDDLVLRVTDHCEDRHFHLAMNAIYQFCVTDLSGFYLDILKDRLYTWTPEGRERRSAQTVLYHMSRTLLLLLAPFLSFTAEEAWAHLPRESRAESIFLEEWPKGRKAAPDPKWEGIARLREKAYQQIEEKRKAGVIGGSLEAWVTIDYPNEQFKTFLDQEEKNLAAYLIVSKVSLGKKGEGIHVRHAQDAGCKKCARCWNWREDVGSVPAWAEVCRRCAGILNQLPKEVVS